MKKTEIGSWIAVNNLSFAEIKADAGFDWLHNGMELSLLIILKPIG